MYFYKLPLTDYSFSIIYDFKFFLNSKERIVSKS